MGIRIHFYVALRMWGTTIRDDIDLPEQQARRRESRAPPTRRKTKWPPTDLLVIQQVYQDRRRCPRFFFETRCGKEALASLFRMSSGDGRFHQPHPFVPEIRMNTNQHVIRVRNMFDVIYRDEKRVETIVCFCCTHPNICSSEYSRIDSTRQNTAGRQSLVDVTPSLLLCTWTALWDGHVLGSKSHQGSTCCCRW